MTRLFGRKLKSPFVCISCRKVFKWLRYWEIAPGYLVPRGERRVPCPDCGAAMRDFGPNFRVPRRADFRGWLKVRRRLEWSAHYLYYRSEGFYLLKGIDARHLPGKGRRARGAGC
jgi:hypothetical protein